MNNNRDALILGSISIFVLAGSLAAGLGQIALGNNWHGENFPMIFGSGILVVGSIAFLRQLYVCFTR